MRKAFIIISISIILILLIGFFIYYKDIYYIKFNINKKLNLKQDIQISYKTFKNINCIRRFYESILSQDCWIKLDEYSGNQDNIKFKTIDWINSNKNKNFILTIENKKSYFKVTILILNISYE